MIKKINQKLEHIQIKVENIQNQYEAILNANRNLLKENNELKLELEAKNSELNTLREKIKIIKLAKNFTEDDQDQNKELKQKLNFYIKEIDKCIEILNQ